jgi:hypothetical protein
MERGFNHDLYSFTQSYGSVQSDASLLVLPQVGFLAYDDEHMLGTVKQMESELLTGGGLLLRYRTDTGVDGLEPGEHAFVACSFWLVEQYARTGRRNEAQRLMNQLVGMTNELGLLSEEFDTDQDRMAGNFPQAFSHLALVRAADAIHGVDRLSLAMPRTARTPPRKVAAEENGCQEWLRAYIRLMVVVDLTDGVDFDNALNAEVTAAINNALNKPRHGILVTRLERSKLRGTEAVRG